jgi:hypothetical protein
MTPGGLTITDGHLAFNVNTVDALDELARIAQVRAKGETGGRLPSRMVISGHNAGNGPFAMFPNVKTIFAYTDTAPGTYSGAGVHLGRWERATRVRTNRLDRRIVEGTRKGDHVAVGSAKHGYNDGQKLSAMDALRADLDAREPGFVEAYAGDLVVSDPQRGAAAGLLRRPADHPGPQRPAGGRECRTG